MKHSLPKLPYSYDALEPYIDAKTMEIHYTKHHQAYIDKLNKALENYPDLQDKPVEDLLRDLNALKVDDRDRKMIRNHGGGHANHSFFWQIMGPKKEIDQKLIDQIGETFGSIEEFKKQFSEAAANLFGSGWAWLVRHQNGNLEICSTPNQDSPLSLGHTPIISLDVWEHAYYIQYKWERTKYIENWWHVLKLI